MWTVHEERGSNLQQKSRTYVVDENKKREGRSMHFNAWPAAQKMIVQLQFSSRAGSLPPIFCIQFFLSLAISACQHHVRESAQLWVRPFFGTAFFLLLIFSPSGKLVSHASKWVGVSPRASAVTSRRSDKSCSGLTRPGSCGIT